MAMNYKTPGVYVEEIRKFPPSITQVETAIPAFVGYTERAPALFTPHRVTSMLEFDEMFGGPQNEENIILKIRELQDDEGNIIVQYFNPEIGAKKSLHNLYYSMRLYYMNGGGPCYVVSIGEYLPIGSPLDDQAYHKGLLSLEQEDEITLIVFPEGQNLSSEAAYCTLQKSALDQCGRLKDRFCIMDVYDTVQGFRENIGNKHLEYGAAYYPNLLTTFAYGYADENVKVEHIVEGGPNAGAKSSSGAAAKGGAKPPAGKKGKDDDVASGTSKGAFDGMTLAEIKKVNNAMYLKCRGEVNKLNLVLSPSSAMAGVYAFVDSTKGCWKAPANVSLNAVAGVTKRITDKEQESLNVDVVAGKSINVVRSFTGRGILVWGARTLLGNDNEWRYISVRRFFNMVEQSVKNSSMQFVFEPNDTKTWIKIKAMVQNFLSNLWRQGALAGVKGSDAFFVRIGLHETMTALDVLEGRMAVEIGMAVVRPAEFIILRFSHKMQES